MNYKSLFVGSIIGFAASYGILYYSLSAELFLAVSTIVRFELAFLWPNIVYLLAAIVTIVAFMRSLFNNKPN